MIMTYLEFMAGDKAAKLNKKALGPVPCSLEPAPWLISTPRRASLCWYLRSRTCSYVANALLRLDEQAY
jgi:hypothetical protein